MQKSQLKDEFFDHFFNQASVVHQVLEYIRRTIESNARFLLSNKSNRSQNEEQEIG